MFSYKLNNIRQVAVLLLDCLNARGHVKLCHYSTTVKMSNYEKVPRAMSTQLLTQMRISGVSPTFRL